MFKPAKPYLPERCCVGVREKEGISHMNTFQMMKTLRDKYFKLVILKSPVITYTFPRRETTINDEVKHPSIVLNHPTITQKYLPAPRGGGVEGGGKEKAGLDLQLHSKVPSWQITINMQESAPRSVQPGISILSVSCCNNFLLSFFCDLSPNRLSTSESLQ